MTASGHTKGERGEGGSSLEIFGPRIRALRGETLENLDQVRQEREAPSPHPYNLRIEDYRTWKRQRFHLNGPVKQRLGQIILGIEEKR